MNTNILLFVILVIVIIFLHIYFPRFLNRIHDVLLKIFPPESIARLM